MAMSRRLAIQACLDPSGRRQQIAAPLRDFRAGGVASRVGAPRNAPRTLAHDGSAVAVPMSSSGFGASWAPGDARRTLRVKWAATDQRGGRITAAPEARACAT